MVARVILDTAGLRVSKPGVDVTTATTFQYLFHSDSASPKLITKGTFTATPNGALPGRLERLTTISFTSVDPPPFVVAIARATSWHLDALGSPGSHVQYTFLDNNWHTFVLERPSFQTHNWAYDNISHTLGVGDLATFASAKFIAQVFQDHVNFLTNCSQNLEVRYAILKGPFI
jgi:hypothetical protein